MFWGVIHAAFFLFLPAGIANLTPVIGNKIPLLARWKTPLDFGKSYRGKRIFGANKSWRGIVSGSLCGGLTSLITGHYLSTQYALSFVGLQLFLFGAWIGFGALLGDAVESFFKRQAGVKPGHSWFPWDQLDYIIGGVIFSLVFVREPLTVYLAIFGLYFGLHLLVSYVGYLLGFKDKPI